MANLVTVAKRKLKLDDAGLAAELGVHRTTVSRMERREKIARPLIMALEKLIASKSQSLAKVAP